MNYLCSANTITFIGWVEDYDSVKKKLGKDWPKGFYEDKMETIDPSEPLPYICIEGRSINGTRGDSQILILNHPIDSAFQIVEKYQDVIDKFGLPPPRNYTLVCSNKKSFY